MSNWSIRGKKGSPTPTPEWKVIPDPHIGGVVSYELRSIHLANGALAELMRPEWMSGGLINHVFQRSYAAGTISAWHAHAHSTDRICCLSGEILLVLYDGRANSPSNHRTAEYRIGEQQPRLIVVPPGIWHGFHNTGAELALVLNMSDTAYDHNDPDHWAIAPDCPDIPYRFKTS